MILLGAGSSAFVDRRRSLPAERLHALRLMAACVRPASRAEVEGMPKPSARFFEVGGREGTPPKVLPAGGAAQGPAR